MGADYLFELISIVHWVPQFIGHSKMFTQCGVSFGKMTNFIPRWFFVIFSTLVTSVCSHVSTVCCKCNDLGNNFALKFHWPMNNSTVCIENYYFQTEKFMAKYHNYLDLLAAYLDFTNINISRGFILSFLSSMAFGRIKIWRTFMPSIFHILEMCLYLEKCHFWYVKKQDVLLNGTH